MSDLRRHDLREDIWLRLKLVAGDPDLEWLMIDATPIKAHPHAAGARGGTKAWPAPRAA